MKIELVLIATAIFVLMPDVDGRVFCFRRLRRSGTKCGGFLRKDRYHSPEACCQGKGQGFAMRKAKLGRNRFRCTSCSSLLHDPTASIATLAKPKSKKGGPKSGRRPTIGTTTSTIITITATTSPPRTRERTTFIPWPTPAKRDPYSVALYPPQLDDDGNIIQWESWSPCSVTCGAGWRSRAKVCDDCDRNDYDNVQSQPCMQNFYCPVDGNWGPWFPWHVCSKSCGGGTRTRQRKCNYPPPAYGGTYCGGEEVATQECSRKPCPVNGQWGAWSEKSACSATCGEGVTRRTRTCDSPAPQNGGGDCQGPEMVTRRCETVKCPIDGDWSLWGTWGLCDVRCGHGIKERKRSCDTPKPQHGGKFCNGSDVERKNCYGGRPCPVDGGWTSWTNFGYCRARRCKRGYQIRSRSCSRPHPAHGGKTCLGQHYERVTCVNDKNCPRNGSWCEWTQWNGCSSTCQEETALQARQRECLCPSPRHGGHDCTGDRFEIRECLELPVCPSREHQEASGNGATRDTDTDVDPSNSNSNSISNSISNSNSNSNSNTNSKSNASKEKNDTPDSERRHPAGIPSTNTTTRTEPTTPSSTTTTTTKTTTTRTTTSTTRVKEKNATSTTPNSTAQLQA